MKKIAVLVLFCILFPAAARAEGTLAPLIISEFQTGSDVLGTKPADCTEAEYDAGKLEFVELYNSTSSTLDLTSVSWRLEFVTESGTTTRHFATLQGTVQPESYFLVSYKCYLQDQADMFFNGSTAKDVFPKTTGGTLRLVNQQGVILDQVSWAKAAPSASWWHEPKAIGHDSSINRIFTDNTFSAPLSPTSPGMANELNNPTPEPEPDPQTPDQPLPQEEQPLPTKVCKGILLSEILPNPEGEDGDKEFIEIHNPTNEPISLLGCVIKLDNNKQFALPDAQILPDQYVAFYSSETKLVLTNTQATTVWLVSSESEQGVKYQNSLGSNISWAFSNGSWQQTSTPTPSSTNLITTESTTLASTTQRTIVCEPGKELNAATNRCKTIAAAQTLSPCLPGQERNLQTNRCRNIANASTDPKPCGENEERNPETNRCRKVAGINTAKLPNVKDIPSAPKQEPWVFWLLGAGLVAAIGYSIFEWRHSIGRFANKFKRGR